jgi:mRNA interferase MazF
MTRGDVVAFADRAGDCTGKPRPAVVVQEDVFDALDSVTVCPLTAQDAGEAVTRLPVGPSPELPLDRASWIVVDKISTVRRNRIGRRIGCLSQGDLQRLNSSIAVFLGLG